MALLPVVKYPDERLKQKSKEVTVFDDDLRNLVEDMAETMYAAPGVGLAAVQVGQLIRLLVLDPRCGEAGSDFEVYVNPEVIESAGEQFYEEGCLSLPDFNEEVRRAAVVRVRYQDAHGEKHEAELDGFRAVIFQHEFDHLNGILATDRISRLKRSLYQRRRRKSLKQEKQPAND